MGRKSILNGKTLEQSTLEEMRNILKEMKDNTKIAYISLTLSIIAIIVSLLK